jgi:Fic family protein
LRRHGIEGLVLSNRRLAKAAFSADVHDVTAQSVLAHIAALERAVALATDVGELTRAHIIELHRLLFEGTRDAHLGGVVREEQNWIGGAASSPRNAEFVPPVRNGYGTARRPARVHQSRDVPTVIHAAIAHTQLETIHPFHDGYGRVGRALILIILRQRGLAPK